MARLRDGSDCGFRVGFLLEAPNEVRQCPHGSHSHPHLSLSDISHQLFREQQLSISPGEGEDETLYNAEGEKREGAGGEYAIQRSSNLNGAKASADSDEECFDDAGILRTLDYLGISPFVFL